MEGGRWWSEDTVAVVTGANKGMGLEVCRQLAGEGMRVVMTARDPTRGEAARESLLKELAAAPSFPKTAPAQQQQQQQLLLFHQLDVRDPHSISALASFIRTTFGGLDILINNAAIGGVIIDQDYVKENNIQLNDLLFKQLTSKGFIIEINSAKECIDSNYYGAKNVTKALLPLLRPSLAGARVINVGSSFGQLYQIESKSLREELDNLSLLSESYLDTLLSNYLKDVKEGTWEGKGWPLKYPSYKMSKVALHAFTRLLARELEGRPNGKTVFCNCVHPGFVKTELTRGNGEITPKEGAKNIVKVALLPVESCPSGKFFYEKKLDAF